MNAGHAAFVGLRPSGETATRPIARIPGRLTALRFVAGDGQAPHRALPGSPGTAHSGASNRGFQEQGFDGIAACLGKIEHQRFRLNRFSG